MECFEVRQVETWLVIFVFLWDLCQEYEQVVRRFEVKDGNKYVAMMGEGQG